MKSLNLYQKISLLASVSLLIVLPAQAQRTTSYTYNESGQVLTEDGPRTDVSDITTFGYDPFGNRISMRNALGHLTVYSRYDLLGNLLKVTDPNGVVTDFTYDARQRLTSITEASGTSQSATTSFVYDSVGNLVSTISADGAVLNYKYDVVERLIGIEDGLGNRIDYQLDNEGNITREEVRDSSGVIVSTNTKVYDLLNRLTRFTGSDSQNTVSYSYDGNDNLTSVVDSQLNATINSFDALNNLVQQLDRAGNPIGYAYDAEKRLTSVTDQRSLTTTYQYNTFDEVVQQTSPDTGTTTFTYDNAGNLTSRGDANSVISNRSYDALNRLLNVEYPSDTSLNTQFSYDSGSFGKGQLTGMTDPSGSTNLEYDALGRIVTETYQVLDKNYTKQYSYSPVGEVVSTTYPSGMQVNYQRDTLGRISGVSVSNTPNGLNQTLASNMDYLPFGGMTQITYGNDLSYVREFDDDYRLTRQELQGTVLYQGASYSYDGNSNILEILDLDEPASTQNFSYDDLDRLTFESAEYGVKQYEYDAVSNRTLRLFTEPSSEGGRGDVKQQKNTYADDSNRLTFVGKKPITHDANGNLLNIQKKDGTDKKTWAYDARNRMVAYWKKDVLKATYDYNGLGQRIIKVRHGLDEQEMEEEGNTHIFHYNLQGQLIQQSNYKSDGRLKREKHYIWLDDIPLAFLETVYKKNGSIKREELAYITADHLNTPRFATNQNQEIVWTWRSDAFGIGKIEKDPDGNGTKTNIKLRFPGQYEDGESGLHYNYFRDYHSGWGRYVQSDPIGLNGGLNTYGYALQNPVIYFDPTGENPLLRKLFKDIKIQGAKRNRKGDGGQVCQVLYKRKPILRIEVHPLDPIDRTPVPHWHIAPNMQDHKRFPKFVEKLIKKHFE